MTSFKTLHFQTSHKHSYLIPISIYSLLLEYFMFSDYVQKGNKSVSTKSVSSNSFKRQPQ